MRLSSLAAISGRTACGLIIALAVLGQRASAQPTSKPLAGFSKVTTLIAYNATGSAPDGISEARLKTVLELKLRTNGLRVLSSDEDAKDPDTNPYVYLEANTLETRNRAGAQIGFAYSARLSVRLFTRIPINTSRAPLEMWYHDTMGVSGREEAASVVERVVNELAEDFLNTWLAANPKR